MDITWAIFSDVQHIPLSGKCSYIKPFLRLWVQTLFFSGPIFGGGEEQSSFLGPSSNWQQNRPASLGREDQPQWQHWALAHAGEPGEVAETRLASSTKGSGPPATLLPGAPPSVPEHLDADLFRSLPVKRLPLAQHWLFTGFKQWE